MDNQDQSQDSLLQQTSSPKKWFNLPTKYVIIFLAVLSIVSFGSTGYLLFTNNKKEPVAKTVQENTVELPQPTSIPTKIVLKPTNEPTPTLTPTVGQTATWSAFISSKYGYSTKYPPGWTAKITAQTDPKILEYVVFNEVSTKAGTLSITLSYGTRTYAQALALDPQAGGSIVVASVSATKKNSKDSNGNKATNVIVPFGLNTIIFNAKDTFASLFNLMLTTLKFTK